MTKIQNCNFAIWQKNYFCRISSMQSWNFCQIILGCPLNSIVPKPMVSNYRNEGQYWCRNRVKLKFVSYLQFTYILHTSNRGIRWAWFSDNFWNQWIETFVSIHEKFKKSKFLISFDFDVVFIGWIVLKFWNTRVYRWGRSRNEFKLC